MFCCYENQVETSISSCGHTCTDFSIGSEEKEELKKFVKGGFTLHGMKGNVAMISRIFALAHA